LLSSLVQKKLSSGTGSPAWSRKKGRKTVVVVMVVCLPMDDDQVELMWMVGYVQQWFTHLLTVIPVPTLTTVA